MDPAADCDVTFATVGRSTGLGRHVVESNLMALSTLDELPLLRARVEQLHHLDMARLRAIDSALSMADREYFPALDERITAYLTPVRAHQQLPSPVAIKHRIKAMLDELDASIATDEEDPDVPSLTYGMTMHADGTADLSARLDAATAAAVDARVRALAQSRGIGLAESHALLLTGQDEGVKVTLNLYRAHDIPDAPVYMPRAGWLNAVRSSIWVDKADRTRDMDEAATISTEAYVTPDALKAYLVGRDDVCRFPGCEVPATMCDSDHTVNHADGGPTSADNLVSLCRHHHNLKTAGHVRYVLDPVTGNVVWLFPDGSWMEDEPRGPLSAESRSWVQTFHQRRDARNERARREAQARRRRLEEAAQAAHQRGDATGRGEEEGHDPGPWAADPGAEQDAGVDAHGHRHGPDGPDEPIGF